VDDPNQEQPFMSHLLELRDRLLRMVTAIFVVFLALFPFANDLYIYVATPLMSHMPEGTSMIATGVAAPFLTPFKLSLMAAVFLSMPFILYQFWAFVAPGLYKHEKKLVMPLLVSSSILFYLGMLFAYYVVFPLVFAFFIGTTPDGVAVMTDISQYLDFVLTLFFAFGLAFEVPIATILLVWMGMTTPQDLAQKRPYIIVGAFVIGMFLTPPDVISQTLLALPMWVLFELGVQFSKFFVRGPEEIEEAPGSGDEKSGSEAADPGDGVMSPSRAGGSTPESILVGAEISAGDPNDPDRFEPMTDEDMEAELDQIEAEEAQLDSAEEYEDAAEQDPVEEKLRRVQALREADDESGAREMLYQVLVDGNEDQRRVARNILQQLDTP
jgi:sec-independent protein translocase protein TatC